MFQTLMLLPFTQRSQYSNQATGWTTWGSTSGRDKRKIISETTLPSLGPTHPVTQWLTVVLSPGVKRPECNVDHPPPSSAVSKKVKQPHYRPGQTLRVPRG